MKPAEVTDAFVAGLTAVVPLVDEMAATPTSTPSTPRCGNGPGGSGSRCGDDSGLSTIDESIAGPTSRAVNDSAGNVQSISSVRSPRVSRSSRSAD